MWMTGIWGWSSFSLDSWRVPRPVSQRAPWMRAVQDTVCNPYYDLHKQSIDVDSFLGRGGHLLPTEHAGHVRDEAHLVQRELLLPGRGLHDGGEEGLGVEESWQPDWTGQNKLRCPGLQLDHPEQKVGVPRRQAVQWSVGKATPVRGDLGQGQSN